MLNAPGPGGKNSASIEDAREADAPEEACRALIARMAAAEEQALAEFYDLTAGRVYALALRITSQRATAEEVVSDVYLQVWRQAGRYDPARGRALVWLLTICRSRALDALRRRTPEEESAGDSQTEFAADSEPLDMLLANERGSAVSSALAALGAEQRQLLALAFYRGMTHSELAACTGMPLGTVKSLLRRAMQKLKQELLREDAP